MECSRKTGNRQLFVIENVIRKYAARSLDRFMWLSYHLRAICAYVPKKRLVPHSAWLRFPVDVLPCCGCPACRSTVSSQEVQSPGPAWPWKTFEFPWISRTFQERQTSCVLTGEHCAISLSPGDEQAHPAGCRPGRTGYPPWAPSRWAGRPGAGCGYRFRQTGPGALP